MPNPLRLTLILSGTISLLAAFFYFHQSSDPTFQSTISSYIPFRKHASDDQPWSFDPTRDGRKYGLSPLQCDAAFPGLLSEISDTATRRQTRGNITRQDLDVYAQQPGTMRIMIYDGNVYVVDDNRMDMEWIQPRGLGTLHSIHRAILALNDPETLPNIEFVMTLGDSIPRITSEAPPPAEVADLIHANIPMWSYSRREEDDNVWLMPDFGWWDWGMMSTPDSVGRKSEEVERDLPFEKKIPKALWRGAVWTDVSVRQPLVDVAKDKEWADVRGLLWGSETFDQDFVRPEDHCRYMFLVYAEGETLITLYSSCLLNYDSRDCLQRASQISSDVPISPHLPPFEVDHALAAASSIFRTGSELR